MIAKAFAFLTDSIWRVRLEEIGGIKAFLIRHLRIIILSVRGFLEDRCLLRASALTFYSLLSIGPVIALTFGIAKGFGLQERLEKELINQIPAQEIVLNKILEYANALLDNTKGGVIAGVGILILFWSVLKVLNHIEHSLNEIWYISETRTWQRKLTNYLSFIVIAPIMLLIYSSVPVFITTQLTAIAGKVSILGKISPYILLPLKLLPYLLVWGVFTFIYIMMPNTRVKIRSGLLGGIIAGTIYLLTQWLYINFQVGVTRYNPIYGSLAALPLLLIWMNLGWIILLIGAEYAYAYQNVETYEFEPVYTHISLRLKKLSALQIVHLMVKRFCNEKPALNASQISRRLKMPIRLVDDLLEELVHSGVVSKTMKEEYEEPEYQPASDINLWTVSYITGALETNGLNKLPAGYSEDLKSLEEAMQKIDDVVKGSPENILIKNI